MVQRSEQELVRFQKLAKLRENTYPYPNDVRVTGSSKAVLEAEIVEPEKSARLCLTGRIVQLRHMGKAAFVHILDQHGKVQLYVKQDIVGEGSFAAFKDFDIGDIIEVKGYPFVTKTGEKSLFVEAIRLLVKGLIPLPEKWHGLSDTEVRYRQRYVDLIANPEVREIFRVRASIISKIRTFLDRHDFLEVETPVLHYIAGGATAKPFKTYYNALDCEMFQRIALELPLKKLVVGGLERVYEIGRVFRNEGISKKHNPEFTMLEFYQAYATFEDLMTLTEELLSGLCREIKGGYKIRYGDLEVDFTPPWPRISMLESIHKIGGVGADFDLHSLSGVQQAAKQFKVDLSEPNDWGRSLEALWGALVEPKLINPVFITHHPFSISPLARKNLGDPKVTDRFELIVAGMEMANAFSELNDPIDQRERFEAQAQRKAAGDQEATDLDEDFVRALEYGLPPTAGEGIGIDRLVMLLTNSPTIREVVLFPQLKPE
ncbi:MAG: lysine--tRNA ligase [Oligoflexia bacterium]|nr:lysine--tRNA ligase [Oligoflexia bacterium]